MGPNIKYARYENSHERAEICKYSSKKGVLKRSEKHVGTPMKSQSRDSVPKTRHLKKL